MQCDEVDTINGRAGMDQNFLSWIRNKAWLGSDRLRLLVGMSACLHAGMQVCTSTAAATGLHRDSATSHPFPAGVGGMGHPCNQYTRSGYSQRATGVSELVSGSEEYTGLWMGDQPWSQALRLLIPKSGGTPIAPLCRLACSVCGEWCPV